MLKQEIINNFKGFPYGYYWSQNMKKSDNGLSVGWFVSKLLDSTDYENLDIVSWFAEVDSNIYGLDFNGRIYKNGSFYYQPDGISNDMSGGYNGMIADQKSRLIFAGRRYVGKYDNTLNYEAGTIAATNGSSAITGSGTTFTSGMVGKRIRIGIENAFYTISAYTDATHITLSSNYAGATGSGKTYKIFTGWTDKVSAWDFGSDVGKPKCMGVYEDWVLIANYNKIALINTVDDSFNASGFTLPAGFEIVSLKSNKNGILIGAIINNKSVLVLWDCYSDGSITPWIWLNEEIKSISTDGFSWAVVTNKNIHITNGYSLIKSINICEKFGVLGITGYVPPQGTTIIDNKLLFVGKTNNKAKLKSGVYILDLNSENFEFVCCESLIGLGSGTIFISSVGQIYLSYSTSNPFKYYISILSESTPAKAVYVARAGGKSVFQKNTEGYKINFAVNQLYDSKKNITFDIYLKLAKLNRQANGYAKQKTTETLKNKITIDGTNSYYYDAKAGDEITVLDGANAGEIRHISAIEGKGTSTEVWTLDGDLTNAMAADDYIGVAPFKFIKKYSFTNKSELDHLYFNLKNKMTSNEFLIKILMENINCPIEIINQAFIYDELPII